MYTDVDVDMTTDSVVGFDVDDDVDIRAGNNFSGVAPRPRPNTTSTGALALAGLRA